ncbi:MAG: transcription-repair coupling factor [Phycisphaeraceae bacterium]|nr:transcription-repair coupling factor [Phycisphaeraceae bacterium]
MEVCRLPGGERFTAGAPVRAQSSASASTPMMAPRMDLIASIQRTPALGRLAEETRRALASPRTHRYLEARGSHGSSAAFTAAALARAVGRTVVYVVAHLDEADESAAELAAHGVRVGVFPALETLPGETGASAELLAARLAVVRGLRALRGDGDGDERARPEVLLCPVHALMQPVPGPDLLGSVSRTLTVGDRVALGGASGLLAWLDRAGYTRVDAIEEAGEYSVRGGIVDIFPPASGVVGSSASGGAGSAEAVPVRIDLFGDEIERINEIDLSTMASDRSVRSVELICASIERATGVESAADSATSGGRAVGRAKSLAPALPGHVPFTDYLPEVSVSSGVVVVLHETLEVIEQARGYFERVTDSSSGVIGPPAVMKALQERSSAFIEINQFSPGTSGAVGVRVELPVRPVEPLNTPVREAVVQLAEWSATQGVAVYAANEGELSRLRELIAEHAPDSASRIGTSLGYVHRGFVWEPEGERSGEEGGRPLVVLPYHELLQRFEARRTLHGAAKRGLKLRAARAMDTFLDFAPGDYVVHREHGIGQFVGLTVMKGREVRASKPVVLPGEKKRKGPKDAGSPDGAQAGEEEFLTIEFAARSRLHVPATRIDQVQKYVGGLGAKGKPTLSALGGTRWKKQKQDVAESVRDLAAELLRIRAARESLPGTRFPADTSWQREFEAEFGFEETPDQLAALGEIKRDMQSDRPMDRLLCGDVGFGKTEMAVRAAFKACEFGRQVAVLVPTTVLAEQHERTFRSRFADYPFRVESLSRFKTTQEINRLLADLRKGQIDVVIGTHRLISKDVKFADLGLVVIDEEQRFGVEHKERLLALRMTVDVLTLSATPIPRTLHLSMLGLRDISSLATPPVDRRAVVTEVIPYNPRRVQQAIARELSRGGQCYFVHNRVYDIQSVADDVQRLAPEARIVVGHGQMPDDELERVMLRFMRGPGKDGADILVSTTIIESGIDIPTANTMFIDHAERFGLADLHQLRGRVGRSKHRAYCYLLLDPEKPVPEKALKRLKAIEEFSMLGAGFKIAMRDLEIRGAGNILGPEQSGHIAAVGYEMYCQLLDRAVKELKNEPTQVASETSIEIGVTGLIPRSYIPSDQRRMEAYRRLAVAQSVEELRKVEGELRQAYGEYPAGGGVDRLLQLAELRAAASELQVRSISLRERDVLLRVRPESAQRVADLLSAGAVSSSSAAASTVAVLPPPKTDADQGHWEVYFRPPASYLQPASLVAVLRKRLVASRPGAADAVAPAAPSSVSARS